MAIEQMPDREPRILHRRISEHRANMQRVVDGIKTAVEATGASRSSGSTSPPLRS